MFDRGAAPVPGQQFGELALLRRRDAGEHVGEPGLRVDVVQFRSGDERRHDGGTIGAAVGPGEEPGFPAECKAAQAALRSIVRQADATVVEEAGEAAPALEHVVDRLGDRRRTRQRGALTLQPRVQVVDERPGLLLPDALWEGLRARGEGDDRG